MRNKLKSFSAIALIVFATFATILLDFVTAEYSTSIFTDVAYWIDTITVQTSVLVILFSSRSITKDREQRHYPDYLKLNGAIDGAYWQLIDRKLNTRFGDYIAKDNHERKLKVYLAKLDRKIGKRKDRLSRIEYALKCTEVRRRVLFRKMRRAILERKRGRQEEKLQFLDYKRSKADEEVDYLRIRFIRYSYGIIFRNAKERAGEQEDPYAHEGRAVAHILISKALMILAFGVIATSCVSGDVVFTWTLLYKACIKLFQIVMGLYSGALSGQDFIRVDLCSKLAIRLNYVQKFIEANSGTALQQASEAEERHSLR